MHHWYLTFILGLAGSWHCLLMCGPLKSHWKAGNGGLGPNISYQSGRIMSYVALGMGVHTLGSIQRFEGQWYWYYLAVSLFLMALLAGKIKENTWGFAFQWMGKVWMRWARTGIKGRSFLMGMGNGFLPCGLVLGAMGIALIQSNAFYAALSMLAFGLATLPALEWSAWAWKAKWLKGPWKKTWQGLAWVVAFFLLFQSLWGLAAKQHAALKNSPWSPVICHPFSTSIPSAQPN